MGSHVCPWWFAYTFDNPLRTLIHKPDQLFAPYIREGMTVADIGCGLGFFSIGLAHQVRQGGKVIALDIQQKMLDRAEKRAIKAGVADIIEFRQCTGTDINVTEPLDFALAFWMVHEVPDAASLFKQIQKTLKPAGLLLATEPKFHVSYSRFQQEVDSAKQAGLSITDEPKVLFSYAALFEKKQCAT